MSNKLAKQSQLTKGQAIINGQPCQITIVQAPDESNEILQLPDERPSQYITAKSRGIPDQRVPKVKLPSFNPLTITLSAITAVCFLVGASMFSISLNSYSNSVDRTHRQRSETNYKF
ncbi:hypothetical protein [cf. Phormidesmis sp. LEGE 11477]|uniref:hypothetical protein n=1 Tax=cf. Phormidesmis sp. LEGE 11477 TaxID=1828680 RepID=UPI0018826D57|nr:hypothetical protein [cf. Phormidesmis sp. LEGE 11477]MBE9063297.1 hypothetical protein [cf. Phormidesmis sp. LEGE 11477]